MRLVFETQGTQARVGAALERRGAVAFRVKPGCAEDHRGQAAERRGWGACEVAADEAWRGGPQTGR